MIICFVSFLTFIKKFSIFLRIVFDYFIVIMFSTFPTLFSYFLNMFSELFN